MFDHQTSISLTTVQRLEDKNTVFNKTYHSEGIVLACDLLSQMITFYAIMFYTTIKPSNISRHFLKSQPLIMNIILKLLHIK